MNPSEDAVVLIWEFPSEFLRCFEKVYILTYLFHGSPMMSYFHAEGLTYTMRAIQGNQLIDWSEVDESQVKETSSPNQALCGLHERHWRPGGEEQSIVVKLVRQS